MQVKILKNVVGTIAGPGAIGIVDLLYGKKNVNEFLIAKKLKLNINQARNILYKLSDEGLVSFVGKKDKKNGGWYTYYWTLDVGKSVVRARDLVVNEIQSLQENVATLQTKTFYVCPSCHAEFSEENALLNTFTCPECGEVLQLRDGKPMVIEIEKKIEKLNEQLSIIDKELIEVNKQQEVVRARKARASAKKAKTERAAKKALKAKVAGKIAKKTSKADNKKSAKKPAKKQSKK